MTRHTADSITDDELDALYAELARLRGAAESMAVRPPNGLNPDRAPNESPGPENGAQTGTCDALCGDIERDRDEWQQRAEQAETALARLHEGEELPTDERAEQTPGQWLWRWNHITPTERLDLIARVQDAIARADRCFLGNHEKRIPELEEHRAALARVRALAERWQYTGDRKGGPLPELRAALAGQAGDGTRGAAVLTVVVTAPTQENANHWAATLRDLITAEHGDDMRLDMTINPAPADQPERTQP